MKKRGLNIPGMPMPLDLTPRDGSANDEGPQEEEFYSILTEYRGWIEDKMADFQQNPNLYTLASALLKMTSAKFDRENHPVYGRGHLSNRQKKAIINAVTWMDHQEGIESMLERGVVKPEKAEKEIKKYQGFLEQCADVFEEEIKKP
ncbi:hypothetical protein ACFL1B_01335 [Nanoarchaeota archaeon]